MTNDELQQVTQAVSQALAARTTPPAPMPLTSMGAMALTPVAATPGPVGVMVAITIPLPDGSEASGYVQLDPSALANLPQVVASMAAGGWPVRRFTPRQNSWGQGGNGWNRGNYGRGRW
jgi:hypothetical protein